MPLIEASTLFTFFALLFVGGILFPSAFQKKAKVISEDTRNAIASELIQAEMQKIKKPIKKKSAELNAAADALVAQVSKKNRELEQKDEDVLALINIQKEFNDKFGIKPKDKLNRKNIQKVPLFNRTEPAVPKAVPSKVEIPVPTLDDMAPSAEPILELPVPILMPELPIPEPYEISFSAEERLKKVLEDQKKLQDEFENLQETNKLLSRSVTHVQNLAKDYQEQVMQLESKCEQYEKQIEEYMPLKAAAVEFSKEKAQLVGCINQLQIQLVDQTKLMEQNSKEWIQRMKSVQESSSKQILGLSSELDSIQRELNNKIARLDAELKREQYEKDAQILQLKLKRVQCEKSDREAFNARSQVGRLQEELKSVRQERETHIIMVSENQANLRKLTARLQESNDRITRFEEIEKEYERAKDMIADCHAKLSAKDLEIDQLSKQLEEAKSLMTDTCRQLTFVTTERDTLLAQLNAADEYISSNHSAVVEIDSKCEVQQLNISILQSEIDTLNKQLSKVTTLIDMPENANVETV